MNGWCWKFPNPKKNTVKHWLFSQQKLPSVQQKMEDVEQNQMRSLVGKEKIVFPWLLDSPGMVFCQGN
jgi:hypothetical protein